MSSLLHHLSEHGFLANLPFRIASVGARDQERGDFSPHWFELGDQLTIYGFDADPAECERLQQLAQAQTHAHLEHYICAALSHAPGSQTLYVTAHPACTSLYPPNFDFCERLSIFDIVTEVQAEISVECTTLDHLFPDAPIDFLKLDIQAAELDVLRGAERYVLPHLLAIQLEVEFNPLYHDQPLFADIDHYLRSQGFSLLLLEDLICVERAISPLQKQRPQGRRGGQLISADAIYYRDWLGSDIPHQLSDPTNLLKLICVLYCLNPTHFIDLCIENIVHLAIQYGDLNQNRWFDLKTVLHAFLADHPTLQPDGKPLSEEDLHELPCFQILHSAKILAEQLNQS